MMKDKLEKLIASLDDYTKGFSSRKLSAFIMMACIVLLEMVYIKYLYNTGDFSMFPSILTINLGFVSTLLAITTYSKLKSAKKDEDE